MIFKWCKLIWWGLNFFRFLRLFLSGMVRWYALVYLLVLGMMNFGLMMADAFFHIEMHGILLLLRFLYFLLCFWRAIKRCHHKGIDSKLLLCFLSILIKIGVVKASGALNTLGENQSIQVFFGFIKNFLRLNTRLRCYFFEGIGQRLLIDWLMLSVGHIGNGSQSNGKFFWV